MKENIMYGVIGLLLGVVITWLVASSAVNNNNVGMMRMMGMKDMGSMGKMMDMMGGGMMGGNSTSGGHVEHHAGEGMSGVMKGMMMDLENKTGDEFDKAFLSQMIMHHEGAVEMAKAAQQNAKHQEIKNMANDIISAQTREINQMKDWQKAWYK
jgi:uncharacterized protein (DUF305 family)